MTWALFFEIMQLLSILFRLVSVPVLLWVALGAGYKGNYDRATMFMAWAIFISMQGKGVAS